MSDVLNEAQQSIRQAVREVCQSFPAGYWRALDRKGEYPEEFVRKLTELGYLSILIPEEYGGGGIHRPGGNQSRRRVGSGLSCADVYEGYRPASWQ